MGISGTIFATALFLFFLMPGFTFTKNFWRSDRGYLQNENFYQFLLRGLLTSTVIYLLFFNFYNNKLTTYLNVEKIKFSQVCDNVHSFSVTGNKEDAQLPIYDAATAAKTEVKNISNNVKKVKFSELFPQFKSIVFFVILCVLLSFFLAWLLRNIILLLRFDMFFKQLKFKNDYYYLFSGRSKKFTREYRENGYWTHLHILTTIGNSIVIYKGTLVDYTFKNALLEDIHLVVAERTGFTEWEPENLNNEPISAGSNNEENLKLAGKFSTNNNQFQIELEQNVFKISSSFMIQNNEEKLKKINLDPLFYPLNKEATLIIKASEIKNLYVSFTPKPPKAVKSSKAPKPESEKTFFSGLFKRSKTEIVEQL